MNGHGPQLLGLAQLGAEVFLPHGVRVVATVSAVGSKRVLEVAGVAQNVDQPREPAPDAAGANKNRRLRLGSVAEVLSSSPSRQARGVDDQILDQRPRAALDGFLSSVLVDFDETALRSGPRGRRGKRRSGSVYLGNQFAAAIAVERLVHQGPEVFVPSVRITQEGTSLSGEQVRRPDQPQFLALNHRS